MYHALLLDHYHHPRNKKELAQADFTSHLHNPSCGDTILFSGITDSTGLIKNIAFQGTGCVISQATASLLSEQALGLSLSSIQTWDKNFILSLIGIELGPTRLKCALLPLEALHQGIAFYLKNQELTHARQVQTSTRTSQSS